MCFFSLFSKNVLMFGYFIFLSLFMCFLFSVNHKKSSVCGGMGMQASSVIVKYQRWPVKLSWDNHPASDRFIPLFQKKSIILLKSIILTLEEFIIQFWRNIYRHTLKYVVYMWMHTQLGIYVCTHLFTTLSMLYSLSILQSSIC